MVGRKAAACGVAAEAGGDEMTTKPERLSGIEHTWYPLDAHVLAVLVINHTLGDWKAYIGAVPGIKHSEEWREVANRGAAMHRVTARALFERHLAVSNTERELAGQERLRWRD